MSRYGKKKSKTEHVIETVVSFGMALLSGWAFMLAVGVIHHEWIAACPTIGFGWSVLLASLIRAALHTVNWDRSES